MFHAISIELEDRPQTVPQGGVETLKIEPSPLPPIPPPQLSLDSPLITIGLIGAAVLLLSKKKGIKANSPGMNVSFPILVGLGGLAYWIFAKK